MSPNNLTTSMFWFKDHNNIDRFRIVQRRKDLFEIFVKKKDNTADENRLETSLKKHLNDTLNLDKYNVTFDIQFTKDIPLSKTGKLDAVVSELCDGTNLERAST